MKTEGFSISTTSTTVEFTNGNHQNSNCHSSNFNVQSNYGDMNRFNSLFTDNTSYNPQSNSLATNNNQQNATTVLDWISQMFKSLAKMFGFDSQNATSQFNNANKFQTGAGAINNVGGKAANMQNDPKIKEAMTKMQEQQAANPGKPVKMKVKGSDGKTYNLNLDEQGNMNIKKKKKGFLSGLGKMFGGILKTGLGLMSKFGSFIPGWGTLASMGSSMLLNFMNKK